VDGKRPVEVVVAVDDVRAADVRALVERHLAFAAEHTPAEHVHALGPESLLHPAVTVYGARVEGELAGVGALRQLDGTHGELKSMHTNPAFRRLGVARALVEHLLAVAAARGYQRVSLETGTMDAFGPARALYLKEGFEPCEPFGEYTANPYSVCMTMALAGRDPAAGA